MNSISAAPKTTVLSGELPSGFSAKNFASSDGVRLTYYESNPVATASIGGANTGGSNTTTLVFVPGWSMPGWIWFDTANRFSATHRVLVLDPRGQGASEQAGQGYNYKRRATDIDELLQACVCTKVVLIGWSLGGLEVLQYSHAVKSANLAAMVLVDHSVGVGRIPTWDPNFFNRLRADHALTMQGFVQSMFKKRVKPESLVLLTQAALKLPLQPAIELLSQPVPREFWRDAVVNSPVPVLYAVIPKFAEQAQIIQGLRRTNLQVRVFEEAGHALFIDDATGFEAEMRDFLRKYSLRGTLSGQ